MFEPCKPGESPANQLVVISEGDTVPAGFTLDAGQTLLLEEARAFLHAAADGRSELTLDRVTSVSVADAADVASRTVRAEGSTIIHTIRFREHGGFTAAFDSLGNLEAFEGHGVTVTTRGSHLVIARCGASPAGGTQEVIHGSA